MDSSTVRIVVGAAVAVLFFFFWSRKRKKERSIPLSSNPQRELPLSLLTKPDKAPVRMAIPSDDEIFELPVRKFFAKRGISRLFYTHLAGVSFRNADGSERGPLICQLEEAYQLDLDPDDTLPKFPNAIAVNWKGKQIGYLPDKLAGEIRRDAKANGPNWTCLFRRHTRHNNTSMGPGALLCVIRLNPEPETVVSSSTVTNASESKPHIANRIDSLDSGYVKTEDDIAFEKKLTGRFDRAIEKIIYDQVAAIMWNNDDGTNRLSVIRKCKVGEFLLLESFGSISSDVDVVGVLREDGSRLGYVEAKLAGELRRDGLHKWACVFRRKIFRTDVKSSSGAILCLVRLKEKD